VQHGREEAVQLGGGLSLGGAGGAGFGLEAVEPALGFERRDGDGNCLQRLDP